MAYKNFVAGEEALAVDVNSYLMSQTVSRFTNATQRTAQVTAPVLNQLTVLDDRPGQIQYWNGSAWLDLATPTPPVIPPAELPAGYHLQAGNVVMTTDSSGGCSTTFPVPFSGNPIANSTEAGGLDAQASIFFYSTTILNFNLRRPDGGTIPNSAVRVMYIAVGPR